jgi:glucose/arabinose dehydrogenase
VSEGSAGPAAAGERAPWLLLLLLAAAALAVRTEAIRELFTGAARGAPPGGPTALGSVLSAVSAPRTRPELSAAPASPALALRLLADGFRAPLLAASPQNDARIFVVEQGGLVRIVREGRVLPAAFLDVSERVTHGGSEQGLLGLAFHPKYLENGRFFVNYSDAAARGATVVAEFRVDPANADRALPDERRLLVVPQPYANHNGGHLAFSPADGFLYIGLGDGGAGGDPHRNGQDAFALLGKMLRIDVDAAPAPGKAYAIPKDNPWADGRAGAPEIWALGLRNPWRYSFDRTTADLWVGDVGQNAWEEVDFQPANAPAPRNYGWNIREAAHCFGATDCGSEGLVEPLIEYAAEAPCNSVTGGIVYRGRALPDLAGTYFYSDFCHDWLRSARLDEQGRPGSHHDWTAALDPRHRILLGVSSFGEDKDGELLIVSHRAGSVWRLVAAAPSGP